MAYLALRDLDAGRSDEFASEMVRLGRDPAGEVVTAGEGSDVVSARHARFVQLAGQWHLEDLGSSNGTFLDGHRLEPHQPEPVAAGQEIRLGLAGPRFRIDALVRREVARTVVETPAIRRPDPDPDATVPMEAVPAPADAEDPAVDTAHHAPPELILKVQDLRSGGAYQARGSRIRFGRGRECEIRPLNDGDTVVSRVHAEVVLTPGSPPRAVLSDCQSRNGTIVNGGRLSGTHDVQEGDRIELGRGGPELRVEQLVIPGTLPANRVDVPRGTQVDSEEASPVPAGSPGDEPEGGAVSSAGAGPASPPPPVDVRRSFGGQGRTMFMKELVVESAKHSSRRVRAVVWSSVVILTGAVGGLMWWGDQRVRETTAVLAQQQDSLRLQAAADLARLRSELDEARRSSAPAAVLDSLRSALDSASARTLVLEETLQRAQSDVAAQLAVAESLRTAREGDVARLERQLARVANSNSAESRRVLDSLRQALSTAEHQVNEIDGQLRAVRGSDLASVAQDNQGAVGLVSSFKAGKEYAGSGFVISPSGYFITNRHVVYQEGQVDSVFVTMADQRTRVRATIVRLPARRFPDLAILQIADYAGPYMRKIDWSGTKARQGEPAALIGFPSGFMVALDRGNTVRTSMSAGAFSMVTADRIQFDGFTVGGSSGSPIFNASGEVVAVHRAGLRDQPGLAFAEPIHKAVELLPAGLKRELGLPAN